MIKKSQKRAEMANMVRAFLLQAFHGDVDRELAQHLYKAVNEIEPPVSAADWTGDLVGSGYDIDRTLTREAQEALGPVFRVLVDGAGGRWLHDTRTITEFYRSGGNETEARKYLAGMKARHPGLRAQIMDAVAPQGPMVALGGMLVGAVGPTGEESGPTPSEVYDKGYADALARTTVEIGVAYQQGYSDALREHHAAVMDPVPSEVPEVVEVLPAIGTLQEAVREYAEIVDNAAKAVEILPLGPTDGKFVEQMADIDKAIIKAMIVPASIINADPLPMPVDPLFNIEH